MNEHYLKTQMMKLWKDTFHDPDEYIKMIFDAYFNPHLIEYTEENGNLISALLCIPYEFRCGSNKIKAIYLCGLATSEDYRHRGIMSKQIEKCNQKAAENGYSLSFLIPASEMLQLYYHKIGYYNAIYRIEEIYTDIHNFNKDILSILDKEDENIRILKKKYYDNLGINILDINDKETIEKIKNYIHEYEANPNHYSTLSHSDIDIECIIKDNTLFNGKILYAANTDSSICGVIFITPQDQQKITIPKIYYSNQYVYYKLLASAKSIYQEATINIMRFPEETNRRVLWEKVYGAANPDGNLHGGAYGVTEAVYNVNQHSKSYGMAKILNINEILKYLSCCIKDANFSILIKYRSEPHNVIRYSVQHGELITEKLSSVEARANNSEAILTEQDLSEILFRRIDSSSIMLEAFGIPRLALNMALLLD